MKNRLPTEVPSSLKGIDIKAILRKRGIYDLRTKNLELKRAAIPLAKKLVENKYKSNISPQVIQLAQFAEKKVDTVKTNPRASRNFWEKQNNVVEVAEKKFHNKIEQFISHIQKGFLSEFESEITEHKHLVEFVKKDYFTENEEELIVKAQLDFGPILRDVANLSGQEAMDLVGLPQPYNPINYNATIRQNVERFTQSMLETERDSLARVLSEGLQSGLSIPEIRNNIVGAFDTYSKSQAQRITRTEVMRTSNEASLDAYKQSEVVQGKQWLTAGADDECEQYEGQIVGLDGGFYSSDSEFADGDPPLHPNCRCVTIPVLENDYPGASLFSDERGFIDIVDDPDDAEFTAYHGQGMNLNNDEIATFGKAFYVSKDPSIASIFGDVTKLDIPIGSGSIYTVHSAREYNQLLGEAFLWAKNNGKNTSKAYAIPGYVRSLGYKAIQFTPEAAAKIDELAGIGIVDLKLIRELNKLIGNGKAVIVDRSKEERIAELEAKIDKRTKEFKELKQLRSDDKVYIKSLEKYLGVADDPPEKA